MKGKFLALLTIFLLGIVGAASAALVPEYVKINSEVYNAEDLSYDSSETIQVEKGDSLTIKIKLANDGDSEDDVDEDLKNIVFKADILGYEYDSDGLSDQTDPFDLEEGDTVYKTLKLTVPEKAEKDYYDVQIRVTGRNIGDAGVYGALKLHITGSRHKLAIKDVVLNKEVTGRYLTASVRVKNYGEKDEEGIKVTVSIPELGVEESDYIDELESDESTTSEELLLKIPATAKEGQYTVKTTVGYDEGTEAETREDTIVYSPESVISSEEKTVVNVGIESQSLKAGQSTVYPIMITNSASSAKTYTIVVSGTQGWGSAVIQPSNVVTVSGGETSTVSVSLSVNSDAAAGEKAFVVEVKSPTKTAQIPLKAVVSGETSSTWNRVKTALEIALIVLVVLLVIIGLIIGFNRLKGNDEEGEEKTYY